MIVAIGMLVGSLEDLVGRCELNREWAELPNLLGVFIGAQKPLEVKIPD